MELDQLSRGLAASAPRRWRFSCAGWRFAMAQERLVLSGLDADIRAGQTTVVYGPSGCGKTTLLNLLGFLLEDPLVSGEITCFDHASPKPYQTLSVGDRLRLRREEFGFVLQSSYLLPHLTCLDNIAMPLALGQIQRGAARGGGTTDPVHPFAWRNGRPGTGASCQGPAAVRRPAAAGRPLAP